VRKGQIAIDELRALARVHGGRFGRVVALTSSQADSGIESITRVRLGWAGIATREQVKIDGHPVDLLVGDRLIIQLDGKQHVRDEAQHARDRMQDRRLKRMGYTVLRYSYADVLFRWNEVLEEIGRVMAQRLHVW
jgi:very-short-patch-repair endonuclease